MKERESNYDLLRILCAFAVIVIHISGRYVNGFTDERVFGYINLEHALCSSMYNQLSRFAVPCFVMLSGAFLLDDERNADYGYFYKKSFKSIGITTLIFSVLYFLYSILKLFVKIHMGEALTVLADPIKDMIKGQPFYHMWYLYMLIGVYMLVPFIIRFKKDIGEEKFAVVSYIFLAASCAGLITCGYNDHILRWDPGFSFNHCGYLMAGYTIRKRTKASNMKGMWKILAAGGVLGASGLILYCNSVNDILSENYDKYIRGFCQSAGAVLMFGGFSNLRIKYDFGKLSSLTFLIYLFHAGIWDIMSYIVKFKIADNSVIFIPLCSVSVFVLSLICAVIYQKLWGVFGGKIISAFGLSHKSSVKDKV